MFTNPNAETCLAQLLEYCRKLEEEIGTLEALLPRVPDPAGQRFHIYTEVQHLLAPQFAELEHLVRIRDWSPLLDTLRLRMDDHERLAKVKLPRVPFNVLKKEPRSAQDQENA